MVTDVHFLYKPTINVLTFVIQFQVVSKARSYLQISFSRSSIAHFEFLFSHLGLNVSEG